MGTCASKAPPSGPKPFPTVDRFFRGLRHEDAATLFAAAKEVEFSPGQRILAEGTDVDMLSDMFVLCRGHAEVFVEGKRTPVADIRPGSVFGEIAVLFATFRTASVVAKTACTAARIRRHELLQLLHILPYARDLSFLRRVDVLRGFSDQALGDLAEHVVTTHHKKGADVVREGEPGSSMFVVRDGGLDVLRAGEPVAVLRSGDTFGMWSLLSGLPRSATCRARSPTSVLEIGKALVDRAGDPILTYTMNREAVLAVHYADRVFACMSRDEMGVALDNLEVREFPPGETVCPEGGGRHTVFVIREGAVDGPIERAGGFAYFGSCDGTPARGPVVAGERGAKVIMLHAEAGAGIMPADTERMDAFEWIRAIGKGAFATVSLVRRIGQVEEFALKQPKHCTALRHELNVMTVVDSPFCVRLMGRVADDSHLCLLLEYLPGGTLHDVLSRCFRLEEDVARFYVGCVLLALEALHGAGVVYRDLKPENLLLDDAGYAKIGDFGFAKRTNGDRCFSVCGTEHYSAPEVLAHTGSTFAVDFWSVGILLFELVTGRTPFETPGRTPYMTYRRACAGRFTVPDYVSEGCESLLRALLKPDPAFRLGAGGCKEVMHHPWFAPLDWAALRRRDLPAPSGLGPPDEFLS